MNELPKRKATRLPEYDYSANAAYFVTVCTEGRRRVLGRIVGGGVLDAPSVQLSAYGTMAEETLLEMDAFYEDVSADAYIVMPNHVHFILRIHANRGPSRTPAPTNARLPAFVSTWKRFTNRKAGKSLWQRSFYDHVIRNAAEYLRVWQYMEENPAHWVEDEYYRE